MKAQYYKEPKDVMLIHPIQRFIARVFGKESQIWRCKTCNKIPTEMWGDYCRDHAK